MALQAGDKLMSLTDVSEMLGIPFTLCTAGGTRATAQSATGWAVTCGSMRGSPPGTSWTSDRAKQKGGACRATEPS
jgi:hypothetical protein